MCPLEPEFLGWIRVQIYARWIVYGVPPTATEIAGAIGREAREVQEAFLALADHRAIVLARDGRSLRMAHPLSAVETPYRVACGSRSYWANCAWDALGIAVILGRDTECVARCGDCDTSIDLSVRKGDVGDNGVVHFAVPPRDFWKDIAYT